MAKAVEIAWKNIRMRLSRSLLVTSGIVLALAFLTSINVTKSMTDGMREWAAAAAKPDSPEFADLRAQRDKLEPAQAKLETDIRTRMRKDIAAKPKDRIDAVKLFGQDLPGIQKEIGALPGVADDLSAAMAADSGLVPMFQSWLEQSRTLLALRAKISAPLTLQQMMKESGVPTTPDEIHNNRIQIRWLLGLALLVAFVGILNAMLMSVTERFREIGTMKCLGALDSFIIKLFLVESLFQGVVGTVLGILGGVLLSLLSVVTSYGHFAWKNMQWSDIATSLAMCLAVGVGLTVAGALYPAWQAARMQPIEAMRTDT
jgi:predicted outer membrane lipoprotein